jgi:hypothetical protein
LPRSSESGSISVILWLPSVARWSGTSICWLALALVPAILGGCEDGGGEATPADAPPAPTSDAGPALAADARPDAPARDQVADGVPGSPADGPEKDAPLADRGGRDSETVRVDGPLALGTVCETASGQMQSCAGGLLCCKPCCEGRPAVCTPPVANAAGIGVGKCPLPDLTVDVTALQESLGFGPITVSPSSCEAREQCADSPGVRTTLHFEVTTPNIGTADLVLGSPLAAQTALGSGFQFSRCHEHYHFAGYALYQLIDASGKEVLQGKKRAFCLLDYEPLDDRSYPLPRRTEGRYDCNFQGISAGWSDSYDNGLTCQYMDLTGIGPGRYTLRVTVNPDKIFPELTYDNNTVDTVVDIPAPAARPTEPCLGLIMGLNGTRECGWKLDSTRTCTPGSRVSAGCGTECGLGTTDGDPMLRVCEGDGPCTWPGLGTNDDCTPSRNDLPGRVNFGARVNFLCPPSGRYTVLTGSSVSLGTASCNVEVL